MSVIQGGYDCRDQKFIILVKHCSLHAWGKIKVNPKNYKNTKNKKQSNKSLFAASYERKAVLEFPAQPDALLDLPRVLRVVTLCLQSTEVKGARAIPDTKMEFYFFQI